MDLLWISLLTHSHRHQNVAEAAPLRISNGQAWGNEQLDPLWRSSWDGSRCQDHLQRSRPCLGLDHIFSRPPLEDNSEIYSKTSQGNDNRDITVLDYCLIHTVLYLRLLLEDSITDKIHNLGIWDYHLSNRSLNGGFYGKKIWCLHFL